MQKKLVADACAIYSSYLENKVQIGGKLTNLEVIKTKRPRKERHRSTMFSKKKDRQKNRACFGPKEGRLSCLVSQHIKLIILLLVDVINLPE